VTTIPLFPLPVVLFPGGYLPLRIFEQRYIDMVRECSATGGRFGVCLVNNAQQAELAANHHRLGSTAEICDFSTLDDGLLGIVALGRERFITQRTRMRDNGLLVGDVELLTEAPGSGIPEQYSVLSLIAQRFMEQVGDQYPSYRPDDLQDSNWVGYRLAELLPLENSERQSLLQLADPLDRLQVLLELLPRFQGPEEA
jgi:Lon protease-like protein